MGREERERLEFLAEMKKGESKEKSDVLEEDSKPEKDISQEDLEGKILKITRKKQEIDGTETVETIEIKKPEVIEAYLKIKYSKTDKEARLNASLNNVPVEESDSDEDPEVETQNPLKLVIPKGLLTDQQKKRRRQTSSDQDGSTFGGIDVPRKKKKEFINSEEKRPRGRPRKKRRPSEADYLMHRPMKRERLRADPLVSISSIFEKILTDLRTALVNDIDIFMKPVDKKTVADYYDVIQNPISIQCIRDKLRDHKYPTRDQFLEDIELIYANTRDYNGLQHPISQKAIELTDFVKSRIDAEQDN